MKEKRDHKYYKQNEEISLTISFLYCMNSSFLGSTNKTQLIIPKIWLR